MEKSRVLVVGGTGYLGRRIVKACLDEGHPTFVLHRREIGVDIEKVQLLLSLKQQGARLVEASFSDHGSLVAAVRQVDVVICAIAGVHIRSHQILVQLKLVDAIKEAGNIKVPKLSLSSVLLVSLSSRLRSQRFLPSEFGIDPARMGSAMEPGKVTFDDKMVVRKAVEEAGIPFTYISAGCFAGYFAGGLCQMDGVFPSRKRVTILGSGDVKVVMVDEDDIARYTVKTVDDPRAANKTVYVRPPENVLSQIELVNIWEDLIGKLLQKTTLPAEDFLKSIECQDYGIQVGMGHFYEVFYKGCLSDFDVREEASQLYPEVPYTRMKDYLARYL